MGRLLIFTAGTSLLENLRDHQKKFSRRDLAENFRYKGAGAWDEVLRRAEVLRDELTTYADLFASLDLKDDGQRQRATAEMAGLYLLRWGRAQPDDRLVLLCSDTGPGAFCALANGMLLGQEVCYWRNQKEALILDGLTETEARLHLSLTTVRLPQVALMVVESLDPTDPEHFERGAIPALVGAIANLHYNRRPEEQTVLNYTGGFKAAVPTLTQAAALAGDIELVCLYEEAARLVQQPLIPINLDAKAEERLIWAGENDKVHPDPLRDYKTLDALKSMLTRAEWTFYEGKTAKGGVQLSGLGLAMQNLLRARSRWQEMQR
jgi:hypothetical protein